MSCIDYLFLHGFNIVSFLEMPYQKQLTYHHYNNRNLLSKEEIDKQKQIEIDNVNNFTTMPNIDYPSDHMALCVDLKISKYAPN